MTELERCKNGIGTKDGCLGPENSIVQFYGNLDNALIAMAVPSAGVLIKSAQLAGQASAATAQAINDLGQAVDACTKSAGGCVEKGLDFCQKHPVICPLGAGVPQLPDYCKKNWCELQLANLRKLTTRSNLSRNCRASPEKLSGACFTKSKLDEAEHSGRRRCGREHEVRAGGSMTEAAG